MSRYRKKQKKIWFNIITLNILTLIIGGCAYYYYETSTLIKSLNTKIEQQNQTIDQQHHAQTALIDANHSLQQQLEEALQTKLTLEDENKNATVSSYLGKLLKSAYDQGQKDAKKEQISKTNSIQVGDSKANQESNIGARLAKERADSLNKSQKSSKIFN